MQTPLNLSTNPSGYRIQLAYGCTQKHLNSLVKDQQILAILGYPVKRKIVDQEGHVILDIGDLITLESVFQAQQANQLDTLFNSIYRSK